MRPSLMPPDRGLGITRAIATITWICLAIVGENHAEEIRFSTQIRPILAENCLHCHGHDEGQVQGNLRLDTREGAVRSAIQPHSPDRSELMARVSSDDDSLRMPPPETGKRLTEASAMDRAGGPLRTTLGVPPHRGQTSAVDPIHGNYRHRSFHRSPARTSRHAVVSTGRQAAMVATRHLRSSWSATDR
jgi:hypothetical protein